MMKAKLSVVVAFVFLIVGCTSESAMLRNDAGQVYQCRNQGWGWLGAPIAHANQSSCVKKAEAAGYHQIGTTPKVTPTRPALNATGIGLAFPAGWETKPLSDIQRRDGGVIYGANKTSDLGVLVSAVSREGITDQNVYAATRRAAQESRLKDASHSDVTTVSINGREGKRFEVTGMTGEGTRVTYVCTLIFGTSQVVFANAWTTAANFADQKTALEDLASRVSGIQ